MLKNFLGVFKLFHVMNYTDKSPSFQASIGDFARKVAYNNCKIETVGM